MKSVLISIQEEHNANIESGRKTEELRTRVPKCELPIKFHTYESGKNGRHKVTNEWICREIREYPNADNYPPSLVDRACVPFSYICDYAKDGEKFLRGLVISDLVIYDKPRELSEFKTICRNAYYQDYWGDTTWFCKDGYSSCAVTDKEREFPYNEECIYFDCPSVGGESCEYEDYAYCNCNGLKPLTRPPQSWCYVESEDEE